MYDAFSQPGVKVNMSGPFAGIIGPGETYGSIPVPRVGESLVAHSKHEQDVRKYNFYDLSYKGGPEYKSGDDAQGCPVLFLHSDGRETPAGFDRRKRQAVYTNHCRPIIDKFVGHVFQQEIRRDGSNPAFNEWSRDVDLNRTPISRFM